MNTTKIKFLAFTSSETPGVYYKHLNTDKGWKFESAFTIFNIDNKLWREICDENGMKGMTFAKFYEENNGFRIPSAIESEDGKSWKESAMKLDFLMFADDGNERELVTDKIKHGRKLFDEQASKKEFEEHFNPALLSKLFD
jgi:hypothetical protein